MSDYGFFAIYPYVKMNSNHIPQKTWPAFNRFIHCCAVPDCSPTIQDLWKIKENWKFCIKGLDTKKLMNEWMNKWRNEFKNKLKLIAWQIKLTNS